jgi:uncharacterized protein (TIGR03435 family)
LIVASVATVNTAMVTVARSAQPIASQKMGTTNVFFDAVSIKPLASGTGVGRGGGAPGGGCSGASPDITPDRIVFENNSVFRLIAWAYGLNCGVANNQGLITGAPPWARSDQFVIQATFPSSFSVSTPISILVPDDRYPEIRLMMRNMLSDRFKLVVHREQKEISGLELVVAKGGPKLTLTGSGNDNSKAATPIGGQSLTFANISMDKFTLILRDFVRGQPIIDRTGLTDEYKISIHFGGIEESPEGSAIAPLFTALQEQLGLKLQKTKITEDVVVIDQLEKPTAN